jgi:hypothetical protein
MEAVTYERCRILFLQPDLTEQLRGCVTLDLTGTSLTMGICSSFSKDFKGICQLEVVCMLVHPFEATNSARSRAFTTSVLFCFSIDFSISSSQTYCHLLVRACAPKPRG